MRKINPFTPSRRERRRRRAVRGQALRRAGGWNAASLGRVWRYLRLRAARGAR